jgi:hypothetical protein
MLKSSQPYVHLLTAACTAAAVLAKSLSNAIASLLVVESCCRNCWAPVLGPMLLLVAVAPALAALRGEFESQAAFCCSVLNCGPVVGWFLALSGSKLKANTCVLTASAAEAWLPCPSASMLAG